MFRLVPNPRLSDLWLQPFNTNTLVWRLTGDGSPYHEKDYDVDILHGRAKPCYSAKYGFATKHELADPLKSMVNQENPKVAKPLGEDLGLSAEVACAIKNNGDFEA